jgi:hypothetical protein
MSVRVVPTQARRGNEVRLHIHPPHPVAVFFNGRPLPKKVTAGGRVLVVTVPGDARSGTFEVAWRGRRYRSNRLVVLP